jgi:4Fe-4S single cluster domain of Ferredoxin I
VNETCPLPAGGSTPPDETLVRARREQLRRFHLGDPEAPRAALPEGVLPASLHALRGTTVRGGWPLLVDAGGAGEVFGRPLGDWLASALPATGVRTLEDNRDRLESVVAKAFDAETVQDARRAVAAAVARMADELELPSGERAAALEGAAALVAGLPSGATLIAFTPRAPHALLLAAAWRRLRKARAAFAAEAQELATTASAFLEADLARRPEAVSESDRAGRLGALGSRFLDAGRLGGVVAHRRSGAPLADERRQRLEAARERLLGFETAPAEPLWVLPTGVDGRELGGRVLSADDPCAAAYAAFDDAAAGVAVLARAARRVRLETAGAFEAERHEPGLERLDWRAFTPEELALVPPVLVLAREADLLAGQLPSLSRLLLSGRPVQVLLTRGSDAVEPGAGGFRFEPAYLGIGHREAFVHQGSVARPQALAAGFARALAGSRTALHVVDAPVSAPSDLDPWLVASARLSGRATPLFWYDPEAGTSWARRMGFEANPEPAADWPSEALPEGAEAAGAPREAAFTFADAALLDPAWRLHFAPAVAADGDLIALAEWLGLDAEEASRRLPIVWSSGGDGSLAPLVVSRALALAARDRLAFWRSLEELAGVRNEYVDQAVARARSEAAAKAQRERAELEARHASELERLRAEADAGAVDRIVAALFEVEPELGSGAPPAPRSGRPPASAAVASGPPAAGAPAPAAAPATAAPPAAAAESAEEAWVDTAMCTSCDECTRKFPAIFAYNGDKQAFVKNARGGAFRDLVLAAEACTAKIIHPGTPWDPSEPELAAWVERARKFA